MVDETLKMSLLALAAGMTAVRTNLEWRTSTKRRLRRLHRGRAAHEAWLCPFDDCSLRDELPRRWLAAPRDALGRPGDRVSLPLRMAVARTDAWVTIADWAVALVRTHT
jgi:hypothetical protein